MNTDKKRAFLNVIYYSIVAVMVAYVIFYFITLANASLANWERITFYMLTALLVVVVAYDIICTIRKSGKHISGYILYGITLAMVVFTLIVMATNSVSGRLLLDITEKFFRVIFFGYLINALAIAIYITGERLLDISANRNKTK